MDECLYCGKPTKSHKIDGGYLCHNCYSKRENNEEIKKIIKKSKTTDERDNYREELNEPEKTEEKGKIRDELDGLEKIDQGCCPFFGDISLESSPDLPKLESELGINAYADTYIDNIVPNKELVWLRCMGCGEEWWQSGDKAFTDVKAFKEEFFQEKTERCPECGEPVQYLISKSTKLYDGVLFKRYCDDCGEEHTPICKECQEVLREFSWAFNQR